MNCSSERAKLQRRGEPISRVISTCARPSFRWNEHAIISRRTFDLLCCSLQEFAGGEVFDEAAVGGEELVVGKFFELHPFELVEDFVLEFAFERGDCVELEVDGTAVAVVVADVSNVRGD